MIWITLPPPTLLLASKCKNLSLWEPSRIKVRSKVKESKNATPPHNILKAKLQFDQRELNKTKTTTAPCLEFQASMVWLNLNHGEVARKLEFHLQRKTSSFHSLYHRVRIKMILLIFLSYCTNEAAWIHLC